MQLLRENLTLWTSDIQAGSLIWDEEQVDGCEVELPQTKANGDVEDWPGPFSTAMKIIRDRAANMPAKQKDVTSNKIKSSLPIWVPKENQQGGRLMKVVSSVQDLCMAVMVENSDAITSLESVPDVLRHKLTQLLCDTRKMSPHFLDLLARGSPSEIRTRDCSWLNDEQFTKTLENTDTSKLTQLVPGMRPGGAPMPNFFMPMGLQGSKDNDLVADVLLVPVSKTSSQFLLCSSRWCHMGECIDTPWSQRT